MAAHVRAARDMARQMRGGNPLRASLLLVLILTFMGSAAVWAALTELDAVTRAEGRIVPIGEVQVVQTSEPGVVSDIHVNEGDIVEAGTPLVTLDGRQMEGELNQAERRILSLELRITRLEAEINGTAFNPDGVLVLENPSAVASELALFEARQSALNDEIAVLERQGRQREQEVLQAETRVRTSNEILLLLREDITVIRPLVEDNIEPRTTLTSLLGREAEAVGRLAEARAALTGGRASVEEIKDRIVSALSASRADALEQLARAEAELAEVQVMLPALEARFSRSVLRSPTRGIVNQINLTTVGSLARAGEPLIEIVPLGNELLVEAYLAPEDVAFVRPGQDVRVSLTAYDASRYGSIEGHIIRVGANAVMRPDRDGEAFVVEIRTSGTLTDADDAAVDILPGMVATVDILSGRRTVLAYITEPLVRVKDTALRE